MVKYNLDYIMKWINDWQKYDHCDDVMTWSVRRSIGGCNFYHPFIYEVIAIIEGEWNED